MQSESAREARPKYVDAALVEDVVQEKSGQPAKRARRPP
jgi:hypothetical protein